MANGLSQSTVTGFPVYRGKVRDVYDLGEHLLIVATDRLSAFDVVFGDPIPGKGTILTQLSLWWFARTGGITANHLVSADTADYPAALAPWRGELEGRSMLGRKLRALRGEFVVRGYLDGSAWKDYQARGEVSGVALLKGLQRRSCFGAPIFTPSTKAEEGHDEPISFDGLAKIVGSEEAAEARRRSVALYAFAHNQVFDKGLILSDTKFEFGMSESGEMVLIDEILTPDSSRYWLRDSYTPESENPVSLDKQYVRDYVEQLGWNKTAPAPRLPAEVIAQTQQRYLQAYEMVTGERPTFPI